MHVYKGLFEFTAPNTLTICALFSVECVFKVRFSSLVARRFCLRARASLLDKLLIRGSIKIQFFSPKLQKARSTDKLLIPGNFLSFECGGNYELK